MILGLIHIGLVTLLCGLTIAFSVLWRREILWRKADMDRCRHVGGMDRLEIARKLGAMDAVQSHADRRVEIYKRRAESAEERVAELEKEGAQEQRRGTGVDKYTLRLVGAAYAEWAKRASDYRDPQQISAAKHTARFWRAVAKSLGENPLLADFRYAVAMQQAKAAKKGGRRG